MRGVSNRVRLLVLGGLAVPFFGPSAAAQEPSAREQLAARAPQACLGTAFADDEESLRFDLAGACAKVSGYVGAYHQNNLSTGVTGLPVLFRRDGTPSRARQTNTLSASATLETARLTGLGELKTSFTAGWSKASGDGTAIGGVAVHGLEASLAGWTVGYTSSLMNFWSGDFQFSATAPSRTVGIVSYEHAVENNTKLALAVESGLPTSRQYTEGIRGLDFSSPLVTARWRYEREDGLALHLSGLVRRAEFPANPRVPFLPPTATTRTGWAASFGATVPVPATGENDAFSMQATFAVDASPFLGTAVDLSSLASTVPTTGPTRGWSVVGSFHHAWSEQWESNVFASYLALDAQLIRARPSVRTSRLGANLYWKPTKSLRFGAEIGWVRSELSARGAPGFLAGISGEAVIGYLAAEWSF